MNKKKKIPTIAELVKAGFINEDSLDFRGFNSLFKKRLIKPSLKSVGMFKEKYVKEDS